MIKSAIEKIVDLAKPTYFEVNGRKYFGGNSSPILEPMPDPLKLATLTGLVEYVKNEPNLGAFVKVDNHTTVSVRGPIFGTFEQRKLFAVAKFERDSSTFFRFGQWYLAEEFIIALQSQFCHSDNLGSILSVVGNIRDEAVRTTSDDGITQTVTARAGIARVAELEVPNPVTLYPYRTFLEVDQPPLLCVLRLKSGTKDSGAPSCALFEADGGLWQIEAMRRIQEWLRERLPEELVVIA